MFHSLYSNKEIFLRELISNASDACDKLRFEAIARPELIGGDELCVELIPDAAAGTLTIKDNGVGMSHDEVIENLGTIARSGTRKIIERSEEHTSELQALMRISYAVFCLKKKNNTYLRNRQHTL